MIDDKILFINSRQPDYLQAMIYDGLERISKYKQRILIYPMNHNLVGMETWEWMPLRSAYSLLLDQIDLDSIRYIIVGSCKRDAITTFLNFKRIFRKLPDTFLIDGEDSPNPNFEAIDAVEPLAVFKREFLSGHEYPDNFFPCPFACFLYDNTCNHNKNIGVYTSLAPNHMHRVAVASALIQLGDAVRLTWNDHIRYGDYTNKLSSSKIGVSVRGAGFDTVRFWEILSFPDTLLFSDRLNLRIPRPFIPGKHFIEYNSENVVALATRWLKDKDGRLEIAQAGYEWCQKYHTTEKRARHMMEIIYDQ